jgi:integral membrane protein
VNSPEALRLAVRAYRVMAYVTGTMLVLLVFICIPLQLAGHKGPEEVVGTLHGILYIIYIVVAFTMTRFVRMKVASPGTIIVLLAGILPVLTFVIERWMTRTYIKPALARSGAVTSEQPVLH